MSAPDFSVIVPACDAQATVAAAIDSALRQRAGSLEVIVVDDGSRDATAEIVRAIAAEDRRVRLISQSNRGLPAARNAGIQAALGRHVALLDSDDLLLPDYLERAGAELDRDSAVGFVYTDAHVFDPTSGRVRRRTAMARSAPPQPPPPDRDAFLLELLQRNFVFVATVIRASVLEEVGGFDETLGSAEDYELWLRILIAGHRAACVPGAHALYRKHPGQMSRHLARMSANLLAVYERIAPDTLPSDAHRALLDERRRAVERETRLLRALGWAVPQRLVAAAKRAGLAEAWYEHPPAPVAAAFPDLRAA